MKISENQLIELREKVSKIIVEHIESAIPEDETIVFTVSGGMDSTFLYLTYLEHGNRPCEAVAFFLKPPYVSEWYEYENLMRLEDKIQHKLYIEDVVPLNEVPKEFKEVANPFLMPSTFKYLVNKGYKNLILGEAGDALFGEFNIPSKRISIIRSALKSLLYVNNPNYGMLIKHYVWYKLLFAFSRKLAAKYHLIYCKKIYHRLFISQKLDLCIPFLNDKLGEAVSPFLDYGQGRKPLLQVLGQALFVENQLVFQNKKNNFNGLIKYCYEKESV